MKKSYEILYSLFLILLCSCGSGDMKKKSVPEILPETDTLYLSHDYIRSNIKASLCSIYSNDIQQKLIKEPDRRYSYSVYDLNGDGNNEYIISLCGDYFRGSGGGTLLLLDHRFEVITEFTVSEIPIYVLSATNKGWKNLLIYSNGAYHEMKYDGITYPSNPTMQPDADKETLDIDTVLLSPKNKDICGEYVF